LTACGQGNDKDYSTPYSVAPTAQTDKGQVVGVRKDHMRAFLGIPYAAPPVGKLSWRPPQPPHGWSKPLDARHFANHCPQTASAFGVASTTEDCLYLNVFTPEDNSTHPVMIWIHGGSLTKGESDDYNPAPLVKQGIVVVTINYRLGKLGFLAHPALSAESPQGASGNYGLMDQQAALEWVQRNIAHFGGNPNNVTIFGESAGGLSVLSQLVAPKSRQEHLFQRAIVESGSSSYYALREHTLATAEQSGEAFAKKVGCTHQSAACLRNVPVKTILNNQDGGVRGSKPKTGTPIVPKSIKDALKTGDFYHVPVIEGTNRNEVRLFVAKLVDLKKGHPLRADHYLETLESTLGIPEAAAKLMMSKYPVKNYKSPDLALAALGTDLIFACSGLAEVQQLSKYTATYAYEFNEPHAPEVFLPPVSFSYESAHASEIEYLFDPFKNGKLISARPPFSAAQKALSRKMIGYWTQFARGGNPNSSMGMSTFWPQYHTSSHIYLSLTPPSPQPITNFSQEHMCDFWSVLG
jgi:para-nitrobenzyl esterase